jgi:nucleotide sugar dehydrogenase
MSIKNISVVGIGRLGLCAALNFAKANYNVLGIDINDEYVNKINNKTLNSLEPYVNDYLNELTNFIASTDIVDAIKFSDYIYIMVDTPTIGNNNYDTKNVERVLISLNSHKIKNKHIVIGCTVLPGYIDQKAKNLLADCENISISYNPEFVRQGSIMEDFKNTDMVLIGEGCKEIGDFLEELYRTVCNNKTIIKRMSPASAEICKLSVNCFITMKIAYSNMIGDIADSTPNANKYDILNAIGYDERIGSKCLIPGYSYGGPCFPRDNRALGYYSESIGISPLLPIATDGSNNLHTEKQIQDYIHENKDVYIIEDVAYKPICPVPIIEESAKLNIAYGLVKYGKKVIIKDRDFIIEEVKKKYGSLFEYIIE